MGELLFSKIFDKHSIEIIGISILCFLSNELITICRYRSCQCSLYLVGEANIFKSQVLKTIPISVNVRDVFFRIREIKWQL